MSSSFIGSQIAIVTKSQCRYVGTIIGIDAQASSVLLANVTCFGTENRGGSLSASQMAGTTVPIMQFANSDIEDLKIVEEHKTGDNASQQKSSKSMPVLSSPPPPPPSLPKQSSIHDDPAIVSAVVSKSNKDSSISSRLAHDLRHLHLSDEQSKKVPKTEESRVHANSGGYDPPWSLLSPTKLENNRPCSQIPPAQQQPSSNKSKFFDDFTLNNSDQLQQSTRPPQRWPSNTHSTQITSRYQNGPFPNQEDDSQFPVRQPFFSDDRPFPHQQNGAIQQQPRSFPNNRRPPMNNNYQQRRPGGVGSREAFYENRLDYNNDFDFETSNRKFNKIASEDEFKQHSESPNQFLYSNNNSNDTPDFEPIYDKKKSFFDTIQSDNTVALSGPMYNRSRNQDTFGNERNYRPNYRVDGGDYRRSNNYRQQRQGNDDFYSRQNNNGYHYRY